VLQAVRPVADASPAVSDGGGSDASPQ
jgi:hypothetical protein